MTYTEIVNEVADILNLTSQASIRRVGRSVNRRYREVASSLGLDTIERGTATATTTIGNSSLTFTCQKIMSVFNTNVNPAFVLDQALFDDLRNEIPGTDPAQRWALQNTTATTVTVYLDVVPATQYTLTADALINMNTLTGSQSPKFAEDYHDVLVYGAMAIEQVKLGKGADAKESEANFQRRLGDLRLYYAKSAYLDIHQGKTAQDSPIVPLGLLP